MEQTYSLENPGIVRDWAIREGSFVSVGHVILTCEEICNNDETDETKKVKKVQRIKSMKAGVAEKFLVKKGDSLQKG